MAHRYPLGNGRRDITAIAYDGNGLPIAIDSFEVKIVSSTVPVVQANVIIRPRTANPKYKFNDPSKDYLITAKVIDEQYNTLYETVVAGEGTKEGYGGANFVYNTPINLYNLMVQDGRKYFVRVYVQDKDIWGSGDYGAVLVQWESQAMEIKNDGSTEFEIDVD